MNPIFAALPTTIFEVMSSLAREHNAINLGQGFPDDPGPLDVRQKGADALLNGYNQYPSMMGLPELRAAIAAHYHRFHWLDLDAATETLVTSGATEALAGAILGLISPGDEVVLFQPMYDAYLPLVKLAGGVPRFVTLKPPHWGFTEADLDAAFTPKTKFVIFNKNTELNILLSHFDPQSIQNQQIPRQVLVEAFGSTGSARRVHGQDARGGK